MSADDVSDYSLSDFNNDGIGNFTQLLLIFPHETGKVIPINPDNNPQSDILFTEGYTGTPHKSGLFFIKNDGHHRFEHAVRLIRKEFDNFILGDIDHDGYQDVLGVIEDDSLFWFKNDGTFHFPEAHIISDDFKASSNLYLKDINGDSLPDIVDVSYVNTRSYPELYWMQNIGGSFGEWQLITKLYSGGMSVFDLNSDGSNEIICQTDSSFSLFHYTDGDLDAMNWSGFYSEELIWENFYNSRVNELDTADYTINGSENPNYFWSFDNGKQYIEIALFRSQGWKTTFQSGLNYFNLLPASAVPTAISKEELS